MTNKSRLLQRNAYAKYWEATSDMVFVKDIDGFYVDASQAFAEVVGFGSPEELIGKTDAEVYADKQLFERYTDDDARLLKYGVPIENYVEPIPSKNGKPRYGVTSKYILRDDDGNAIGIFGISHDITAEYEVQKSYEDELRNLFELPTDASAAVLFDVTEWRVVDARFRDDTDQVVSRYSLIDDYVENMVAAIVDDEEVRAYFSGFSREFLEAEYGRSVRNRSFAYLRRMRDGKERWVRDELHFLLDPVNGHLSLIVVLHDIDDERREYAQLVHAAERDAMTGLLNHDATIKRIEEYMAGATGQQALFMIDLDNFKQVNDSFGHQYGDAILKRVSETISLVFRATDIVGRLGGDEFMALMKDVHSEEAVRRKAESLLAALQFSIDDGDTSMEITASVGVTLLSADDGDFNTLYSEVDAALYQSKGSGKNQYTVFGRGEWYEQDSMPLPAFESISTVQLRTLLTYMDGGVVMAELRDEIHVTYVSPSLFRSLGYGADAKPAGKDVFAHVAREDMPGLMAALHKAAESDDLIEHSYRVNHEEKLEWRRIRVKCIPETGDGIPRLVAVITDISDLKHMNEHLLEAEARYRTAIEQTDAMLWEVDIETKRLTCTGSAWESFNAGVSVFPDAPECYILAGKVHPDSVLRLRQMFADLYAGDDSDSYFMKLVKDNREEVWVKERFKLLRGANGKPYCALGIAQLAPNTNAEMQSFAQEMRFADIVKSSLLGYFRANLTKNLVERAVMEGDARYNVFAGMPYDAYQSIATGDFVDEADGVQFGLLTSRTYLSERFRAGEKWKFIDYRRVGIDGVRRWTVLFVNLMRHPISGEVYAFSYIRDNEVRRNWELALNIPLSRNATLLLYSQESMEALAKHILSTCPGGNLAAVSVIELIGLERIRNEIGEQEAREILVTFGRLCRIAIGGNVVSGQLGENRIALLRADAGSAEEQRERVSGTMTLLKELLTQAHPKTDVNLIGGFAAKRADGTSYAQLLRRAEIACKSAAQTLSESAVAYVDTGLALPGDTDGFDLEERYHSLALRYQQQANMLRITENDELTGLLGKSAFYRRVREIVSAEPTGKLAIVRFDINRFKVFNDVRGTAAGDRLLIDIAAALKQSGGHAALYGRLESDHFALLTQSDPEAIRRSGERLADWLAGYATDFRLSATVGVYAIGDPGLDVSLMCDRALLALRNVKTGFDTKIGHYNYTLRYRLIDEQELVGDMTVALQSGQFLLYFQPQVNYETGMLSGAEALVRWNHPKRGLLPPSVFIPLFERNGLITRLDEYVWDACCAHIRDWMDRYPQARALSMSVSVNVSRLDIYDTKLGETLKKLIAKYKLPASALRLEITESAYMENPQQLIDTVQELHAAGFLVEMDDFGSGYSSLNTLKDVVVDVLKLDLKFLSDCADSARGGNILSSVIRMAHWLKLPIITEGVETKEQADYLKSLGCVYMQGYYFARPMPASQFEKLLIEGAASFADQYKCADIEGMAAFWDPSAQAALLFNSFVGGAAIMEYRPGALEALRVNDNFYKALGTTREEYLPIQTNLLDRFDGENRAKLIRELDEAVATGEERDYELCGISGVGGVTRTWTYSRVRLLAKNENSAILYVAIEDITDRKRLEQEREIESERTRLLMQTTGLAFFDYDLINDTVAYQVYLPERGITKRVIPHYYDYLKNSAVVTAESAAAIRNAIEASPGSITSGEFQCRANLWNTGMRWCRIRFVCLDDDSGRAYRWTGQVDDIQDIKDRASISESIRERMHVDTQNVPFNSDVVNEIFDMFHHASDIAGAIDMTLALMGEYFDISRAYIFEDAEKHTAATNTFEWCAEGVSPEKENLRRVSYADMGGREAYTARFAANDAWYCPDVKTLEPDSRAVLEPQGIRSMLQYAIREDGVFSGFVGFDECRENRRWTDEQAGTLLFVSRIIALYLLLLRGKRAEGKEDFVSPDSML